MKYDIVWIDSKEVFEMNGSYSSLLCTHLYDIANKYNIQETAYSESHLLAIIQSKGVEVNLLEEGGSKLCW